MSQEKSEIVICMGSSCFSRGNKQTLGVIKSYLKEHELEEQVIFRGAHCMDICEKGPVLIIDGTKYTQVSPDEVKEILETHFSGEQSS